MMTENIAISLDIVERTVREALDNILPSDEWSRWKDFCQYTSEVSFMHIGENTEEEDASVRRFVEISLHTISTPSNCGEF
jgi:hypothetical protein